MDNLDEKRELVKIGELAEKVGLPVPTIRHYTKLGLLKVSAFTDGGQYLYEQDKAVEDLKYISELVGRGMKLHEIGEKVWGRTAEKKVIIIDDDVQAAELLKSMINRFYPEWEIEISNNVFDAGRMLVHFLPDLVMLDIRLPAVEGFEICKFIKGNIALKNTKIISVSGDDSKETKERIINDGADAFMLKPIYIDNLMSLIKRILNI